MRVQMIATEAGPSGRNYAPGELREVTRTYGGKLIAGGFALAVPAPEQLPTWPAAEQLPTLDDPQDETESVAEPLRGPLGES